MHIAPPASPLRSRRLINISRTLLKRDHANRRAVGAGELRGRQHRNVRGLVSTVRPANRALANKPNRAERRTKIGFRFPDLHDS